MNVTFHALGGFATAAVLSLEPNKKIWNPLKITVGFLAGVLMHGVLDLLPHQYPLPSKFDVIFALILLAAVLFLAQKQNRLLILICFGGAIFPDVVDLSPEIIKKYLEIEIPHLPFKIFPWHWKEYSGSIYDGSRTLESNIYHILMSVVSFGLIYAYRKRFLKFWEGKREIR